jgi:hypothetical protein
MRAARLVPPAAALGASALIAFAAAGCGTSSAGTSAGARPAATTAAPSRTADAAPTGLAARLLTPKDLPAGWAYQASATNPTMATPCPVLNPAVWNAALADHAEADLTGGMTGPYLVEQLSSGTAQQIDRAWQVFVGAIGKCSTFTHDAGNGSSTFTITQTAFPSYGEGSYGFNLTLQVSGGVTAHGSIVVVRKNTTIATVYLVGLAGVAQSQMETIVSAAAGKL